MKKQILIISGLTLIAVCLLMVKTFVSNDISTSGELLGQIKEKSNEYKMENAILGEELYAMVSLTNLSKEASKLGFVDQKNVVSLSNSLPLAIKQ